MFLPPLAPLRHKILPAPPPRRIGLFGGSFDPPHYGHLGVSRFMKIALRLDEIWWLVAPQNPLKEGSSSYGTRYRIVEAFTRSVGYIVPSDIERRQGFSYTFETAAYIKRTYPTDRFVWIMGEDSFCSLPQWERFEDFLRCFPLAVYPRRQRKYSKLPRCLAPYLGRARRPSEWGPILAYQQAPVWIFFPALLLPVSSTQIRQNALFHEAGRARGIKHFSSALSF